MQRSYMNKKFNIAIDGPAGSGKSTIAKILAEKLNILYIDTGAMFRTIALKLLKDNIDIKNEDEIKNTLNNISIDIEKDKIYLNGENVSKEIRENKISIYTSEISKIKIIRDFLLKVQRDMAKNNSVVMDGRDIGTIVLPNADIKIYMDSNLDIRAKRRYKQLIAEGNTEVNLEILKSDLEKRDKADMNRKIAPLKIAEDAIVIDNSNMTIEESVNKIIKIVEEKNYVL